VGRDVPGDSKSTRGPGSFNPRARVGRDQYNPYFQYVNKSFNPRARVGRDLCASQTLAEGLCFNPRARVGRDAAFWRQYHKDIVVSIHAPAWGATYYTNSLGADDFSFNPRARVGRDRKENG